jgi:hypothetical protein
MPLKIPYTSSTGEQFFLFYLFLRVLAWRLCHDSESEECEITRVVCVFHAEPAGVIFGRFSYDLPVQFYYLPLGKTRRECQTLSQNYTDSEETASHVYK